MKFIDSGSQQGEAAVHFIEKCCMADCTKEVPEAKGLPLEQGSPTHSWLDDLSSEELDKLLQDAERQRQVRIDESCSRNMNLHDKSVASIQKNIEVSLIEDLQDRTPAPSVHEPPSGASISDTATFELQPKRMYKVPAALRSPYIDYNSKNTFNCSKEICMVYNVVCRASGRSTRSSQSSSPENLIIINYFAYFVSLAHLSKSVRPKGKLLNTTYLQDGQIDHAEVKRAFHRRIQHLDHFQMVLFPILQTWTPKGLDEKVGHYLLLVLNLRAKHFEVLNSMRSLNDEKLASCSATLVSRIKEC
ncbi:uncharacterized protein LOC133901491 [Phragmites australis]|uniref:uncharacterized protein LOC133901491 n=1 Tax=Phragmites australis TaxID=29695 RepID=UPI002D78D03F|nr:uncharacterized protein LOC133901491 [Phragmites australis]